MMKYIDLRSDTVTLPTKKMMDAIMNAELGDDVKGEDASTNKLEAYAAEITGKEAGMLVTSGTMGNTVCVMTHTQHRRPELIAEFSSHILSSEGGNYAHFGGVAARGLVGRYGMLPLDEVKACIRDVTNPHHPITSLICLENTHNYHGGTVVSPGYVAELKAIADAHHIPMHLDGARLFNASVALNIPAAEIAKPFDSVQFCLSKGLSAPIGSVVVGSKPFIEEARHIRKMLGGGMRQCGIIAAAGLVALTTMVDRLAEDHQNARELAAGISKIQPIAIDMDAVQTNIVRIEVSGLGVPANEFCDLMEKYGVLCGAQSAVAVRFVLHRHITREDVCATIEAIERAVDEIANRQKHSAGVARS